MIRRLETIRELAAAIGRPVRLMEVCGTHTMAAFRSGLRTRLPASVTLLAGPGCPVCVTPDAYVDRAIAMAKLEGVTIATFGDLVRVPGTDSTLERARAEGGRVQVVYSPADALEEARRRPERTVVFLGVGFETTAPAVGWTVRKAAQEGLQNYLVLVGHKLMPPAMNALLRGGEVRVDGFLCPGHVSVVIGTRPYAFICQEHGIPCVVAGFEPADMIEGIARLLRQICDGRAEVENQYVRSVSAEGNPAAQALLAQVFEPCETEWRGLGVIPGSGLRLRDAYAAHDAGRRWADLRLPAPRPPAGCRCGDVLRGARLPTECPLFACACTPESPKGACMVSSEGTCAAYYKYRNYQGSRL